MWFFLLACSVFSQVKMSDLLEFPISESEMGSVIAREEYLSSHKFNSPWLRELDFRIRPNDLETSISDYRLRFGILNPLEIKANRDYYNLLVRQQSFERKRAINDVLRRRYELILEGYYLMRSAEINEEHLRRLNQIRSFILEEAYDVGKVIALDEKITKQELTIIGIKRSINRLMPAYRSLGLDSLTTFPTDDWIPPEQLAEHVALTVEGETLKSQIEQQQLERETSMLQVNKAEAFSNLGFIQAEYDTDRGDSRDEQVSFQVGVQIPIFNTDRPDNQRRELALIEDQADYETLVEEEGEDRRAQVMLLADFITEWRLLASKERSLQDYRDLLEEVGGEVEDYERLASYRLFIQDKRLRVHMDIYVRYINYLADAGELSNQPYQNFLVSSLATFELNEG